MSPWSIDNNRIATLHFYIRYKLIFLLFCTINSYHRTKKSNVVMVILVTYEILLYYHMRNSFLTSKFWCQMYAEALNHTSKLSNLKDWIWNLLCTYKTNPWKLHVRDKITTLILSQYQVPIINLCCVRHS
jgi:hypothetical protein